MHAFPPRPGLDVLIQVVESGEKVRGEVLEVAGEDVWVLFFPRGDNRVKLRPALDRLAESFDLRNVGTGLHETRERIIVIDVLCDMIGEIFEILHWALEVRVDGVDILHSSCTKELMHYRPTSCSADRDAIPEEIDVLMVRTVPGAKLSTMAA